MNRTNKKQKTKLSLREEGISTTIYVTVKKKTVKKTDFVS